MLLLSFNLFSGAEWEAPDHWPRGSSTHRDTKSFPKVIRAFCARYRTVNVLGGACQLCKHSKGMEELPMGWYVPPNCCQRALDPETAGDGLSLKRKDSWSP